MRPVLRAAWLVRGAAQAAAWLVQGVPAAAALLVLAAVAVAATGHEPSDTLDCGADAADCTPVTRVDLEVGGLRVLGTLELQGIAAGNASLVARPNDLLVVDFDVRDLDNNPYTNETVNVTVQLLEASGLAFTQAVHNVTFDAWEVPPSASFPVRLTAAVPDGKVDVAFSVTTAEGGTTTASAGGRFMLPTDNPMGLKTTDWLLLAGAALLLVVVLVALVMKRDA